MKIIPIHPDDVGTTADAGVPAPDQTQASVRTRRTFGRRLPPSRRTFGRFSPSRRTFGFRLPH